MNHLRFSIFSFILLGILSVFSGCEEVLDNSEPVVLSEQIIYISGETVRMTGRVLSLPAKGADDRGFQIATDENFSSPIKASSGPTDLPGRFITEYSGLSTSSSYYARAYVEVAGEMFYGTVLTFGTLEPFISDFEPKFGVEGITVTITGGNFTSDTKVYVNGNEAEITDQFFESKIKFRMPPVSAPSDAQVKVVVRDQELVFSQPFNYVVGLWKLETSFFDDTQLFRPIALKNNNEVIIGLGRDFQIGSNLKFWKLNLDSRTWQAVPYAGSFANQPFYGNKYFGGGALAPGVPNYEFWTYDFGNQVFVQLPSLPFEVTAAQTVETSNGFYILGGIQPNGSPNLVIYFYDYSSGSWTEVKNSSTAFPLQVLYFDYQELLYIFINDALLRYDIQNNEDQFVSWFPGTPGENGIAEIIGNKVYIGLFDNNKELWEYDLTTNIWKAKAAFTGVAFEDNVASWVYNEKLYVMRSARSSFSATTKMEIWTFEPENF